jgi:hypothetical protein
VAGPRSDSLGAQQTIPTIVWGFASTVGTVAMTGREILSAFPGNPVGIDAVARVLGGLFGIVSERVAGPLTRRVADPAAGPVVDSAAEGEPA